MAPAFDRLRLTTTLKRRKSMKSYYVYILKCSDGSYYTGVTNNIEKRLAEHNSDNSVTSYTFKRRPVELVYCQEFNDIKQAIELEKQIKGWSRRKKEALINEDWEKLKLYSKNYTDLRKDGLI
jgi:putative endonuclease